MTPGSEFGDESERLRVVATARDEGEYDVFVAAWAAWHGAEPSDGRVEADFATYLRDQSVPPYVRHFVRQWLLANPSVRRRRAADRRAVRRARLLALSLIVLAVVAAVLVGRRF